MDLAAFVKARLDEDEAAAQAAWGVEWSWRDVAGPFRERPSIAHTTHIARHDPARVLRDVAFKRHILEAHYPGRPSDSGAPDDLRICAGEEADGDTWQMATPRPCPAVRALAAVWSDHPDYDPS